MDRQKRRQLGAWVVAGCVGDLMAGWTDGWGMDRWRGG